MPFFRESKVLFVCDKCGRQQETVSETARDCFQIVKDMGWQANLFDDSSKAVFCYRCRKGRKWKRKDFA